MLSGADKAPFFGAQASEQAASCLSEVVVLGSHDEVQGYVLLRINGLNFEATHYLELSLT